MSKKSEIYGFGILLLFALPNSSDMDGVYLLGKQKGTQVLENIIHDCICAHYGGYGIYTDEDSELLNFGFKKTRNLIINRS